MYRYRTYRKRQDHPSVMTVYSAPNCLDTYLNCAAVLKCDGNVNTVRQFNWRPHPFRLHKFVDAFSWSLPFICEKGEPARPLHAVMLVVD